MGAKGRNNLKLISLVIVLLLYIVWSQLTLYHYRIQLEQENQRVYNIADNFEFSKQLIRETNGYLDFAFLSRNERNIHITEIKRREALQFLEHGDKLYAMFYDDPAKRRREKLNNYFSDLVLNNYFSVVTDSNGKIKEMFWDKP